MENTIQTQQPKNRLKLFVILGLCLLLIVGLLAVFQRVILQNRAAVPIGGMCNAPVGTCSIPQAQLDEFLKLPDEERSKIVLAVYSMGNKIAFGQPQDPIAFTATSGDSYTCTLENNDGTPVDSKVICLTPDEKTAPNCQGPTATPTLTPTPTTVTPTATPEPTPIACPDCGNPGFKCTETAHITSATSCPIKALWKVEYKAPSDTAACKQKFTELDCDKHTVIVRPTNSGVDEILTKDECLAIKAGTYTHRVDKGLKGEGCQEYKIVVVDKTSTPPGADITNEVAICQNCIFEASCPDAACSQNKKLPYAELIDIPELKPDYGECTDQEKSPNGQTSPCYLSVGNKCAPHGSPSTFRVCALGRDARIWVDDPYNGGRWIKVNFPPGENCTDIEYKYENSGLYDVVLECRNPGTSDQNFHCQERITRHCANATPTPPNKCIEIKPVLTFECKDCEPTPTPCVGDSCPQPDN